MNIKNDIMGKRIRDFGWANLWGPTNPKDIDDALLNGYNIEKVIDVPNRIHHCMIETDTEILAWKVDVSH